jgi:outer membrane protein assembly factor BamB
MTFYTAGAEREVMRKFVLYVIRVLICAASVLMLNGFPVKGRESDPAWSTKLDSRIRFYQIAELPVILVGTEKSLYAIDANSGELLWRRKNLRVFETDVAPVASTDLLLLSLERDDRTRLEAIDIFTGDSVWRSDTVRGAPMQMALDLDSGLLAVTLVRNARAKGSKELKRRAVVCVFDLKRGEQIWKQETAGEIEMMPVRWNSNDDQEFEYALDNYHPPMFLDNRLYTFYEGVTSLDARTGKKHMQERFRVNEEGLALTEGDPVFDDQFIYTSGRGRVRAISRKTDRIAWEAKDLGLTPEIFLHEEILYVRTGGQFTRIKDSEVEQRGPYGVSAIDARTGKILWRYKGADKGITNIAMLQSLNVLIADRDDLILLNRQTGRREAKLSHGIKDASFVMVTDRGEAVVGGTSEIASFDLDSGKNLWRARHNPPGRGILRTVTAVALRAASLYFRYAGAGMAAFRGVRLSRAAGTLRWSGIARSQGPNLTAFATNSAREYVSSRFYPLGFAARINHINARGLSGLARTQVDVDDRLIDRLDPARAMERLSRFLMDRRRFASLRGERMFFYTDLKSRNGRGLVGVNVNTGEADRELNLNELDDRFITDGNMSRLYLAKGERLMSYVLGGH